MTLTRKNRKMRKNLRVRKRRNIKTRRRRRRNMKGGGCACASPIVGGRRRRIRTRRGRRRRRRSRRKSRRRRRTRRRKTRGGGALQGSCVNWKCDMPSNIGHQFTGYKYNKTPFLPDPKSLNSNIRHHYSQTGGGVPHLLNEFGLGDLLLNYYKGTNAALDLKHRYKGAKKEVGADPMNQPKLIKDLPLPYATPNVPMYYDAAAEKAAKNTIK